MKTRASFGPSNLAAVCALAIMFAITPAGAGELAPELEAVLAAAGRGSWNGCAILPGAASSRSVPCWPLAPAAVDNVRVLWGINGVALSATPYVL